MKEDIRRILRENLEETMLGEVETEAPAGAASHKHRDDHTDKATEGDYERLRNILRNDIINHAGVCLRLWGSKDATKRSLFRKKLHKETNDEGGTYEFDKDEMAKLFSILDNLKNDINTATSNQVK